MTDIQNTAEGTKAKHATNFYILQKMYREFSVSTMSGGAILLFFLMVTES